MNRKFRTIAMYLPQFYRTAENDAFWGEGFTDWVSVREASPLFPGHPVPRVPLGGTYYDLTDADVLREQAGLAAEYGIDGFCFYHYYFGDGRRVLEKPAELLLAHTEIPMTFCFSWANDAWVRSWSGREDGNPWADKYEPQDRAYAGTRRNGSDPEETRRAEQASGVLIEQEYGGEAVWTRHFQSLLPYFRDPRYLREGGKPVFLFYKPELIADLDRMAFLWRKLAEEAGLPGLFLIGQNMTRPDPGLDAALIHAPSQILPYQSADRQNGVRTFSYRDVWNIIDRMPQVNGMRTFYGGFVDYDDTPRRGRAGMLTEGADPSRFGDFYGRLIRKNIIDGNDLIFLNAWNEWGECNYLEPDERFGPGYLEAVRQVLTRKEYLTEKQYMLDRFDRAFSAFRDKKILLYGTGANAKAIIENFRDRYQLAGVLEDHSVKTSISGLPVCTREEALSLQPDILVLAVQIANMEKVYRRVSGFCREHGIALFDMYGKDEVRLHQTAKTARHITKEEWKHLTAPYDAVCIDLLDTLFFRDRRFGGHLLLNRELADALRSTEEGKEIFFTAEEGVPYGTYEDALRKAGLTGTIYSEEILGRKKLNGLFRVITGRHPEKKILHIGNDIYYDALVPRLYGMDALGYGDPFRGVTGRYEEEEASAKTEDLPAPSDPDTVRGEIRSHEVISFDVFDTLLTRTVRRPEDVFFLLRRKAAEAGIFVPNLAEARKQAQYHLTDPNLGEIYEEMRKLTDLAEEEAARLLALELEAEEEVLSEYRPGKALFEEAVRTGKRVFLTTDMYLPEEVIRHFLDRAGIRGYEKLLVSCEYRKQKAAGLFEDLKKAVRKDGSPAPRILHIGDDPQRDLIPANRAGLDACLIARPGTSREERKRDTERYAEKVAAPLLIGYVTDLANCLTDESAVLFAARDGFLMKEIYEMLREKNPSGNLPEGKYFYTSRMAAFRAAAGSEETILEEREHCPSMTVREFLTEDLGLSAEALPEETAYDRIHETEYLSREAELIAGKSREEKQGYLSYMKKAGLSMGSRYAFADFVSAGTTQEYLERFCPFALQGYYAGRPDDRPGSPVPVHTYLTGPLEECLPDFRAAEYLIASEERHLEGFRPDGQPVFSAEYRTEEELELIRTAHRIILREAKRYFEETYVPGEALSAEEALKNVWHCPAPDVRRFIRDDRTGRIYAG